MQVLVALRGAAKAVCHRGLTAGPATVIDEEVLALAPTHLPRPPAH